MAIYLFSVPTPHRHQVQLYKQHISSLPSITHPSSFRLVVPFCSPSSTSSSSTSTSVIQEGPSPSPDQSESTARQSGCKSCGREEIEKGCNGEGRIQGGIATVPGFGWWPIKAYRPCPEFVASGGRYRRQGQSMDEVAFGRGETPPSVVGRTESDSKPPSKKKEGSKKLKT